MSAPVQSCQPNQEPARHTATPWSNSSQYLYGGPLESPLPIASGKKEWATDNGGPCHAEAVANAAFIVEAVNSHASLKARVEELEAKTALVTFNEACKRIEELEAALRNTEGSLSKVANWLGRLAGAAEQRAKDTRFLSLADANAADAKNYRATIASIMPVLQAARAALRQSSTPARAEQERGK